jgi:hypothetical protein
MNSYRLVRLSDSVLLLTDNTARNRLPLCVLGLLSSVGHRSLPLILNLRCSALTFRSRRGHWGEGEQTISPTSAVRLGNNL